MLASLLESWPLELSSVDLVSGSGRAGCPSHQSLGTRDGELFPAVGGTLRKLLGQGRGQRWQASGPVGMGNFQTRPQEVARESVWHGDR